MSIEQVDCVVVGAGVVGLSIARALALKGREVVILEVANAIGTQTSSRNSEVIHAGLSYAPGSLKARLCRIGRDMLYAYAAERGIGHRRLGKLIVATAESETEGLHKYLRLAAANNVDDLRLLSGAEVRQMEPEVVAVAGLHSPSTGIIDSHGLMVALLGDAENAGAILAVQSPVVSARVASEGIELTVGGSEPMVMRARTVVNAAGLQAADLARSIVDMPAALVPDVHYAIGHYYTLQGRSPFTHLVYPIARQAALRVHVTLDVMSQ